MQRGSCLLKSRQSVLEKFEVVVGQENVKSDAASLAPYYWSTIPAEREVLAVVQAADTGQVQKIVCLAGRLGISIFPISRGNNWGYGSALPPNNGAVVLDLRGMNRVLSVNEELAYAEIEPGVTQGQLFEYLIENKLALQLTPTGAGPEGSIVGNILERGFSLGPLGDRFGALCSMEIVMPDGEILRTGFSRLTEGEIACSYSYGVGPYLDGIFSQSSLGIVTKMGIWLERKPECLKLCYFSFHDHKLESVVDTIRSLIQNGSFPGMMNLISKSRILCSHGQYPWSEMEDQIPLSEQYFEALGQEMNIPDWVGIAPCFGTKFQMRALAQELKHALSKKVIRLHFLSNRSLYFFDLKNRVLGGLGFAQRDIGSAGLKEFLKIFNGEPSEVSLSVPYWRNRDVHAPRSGINPARDNCGLIWVTPTIPITGRHLCDFLKLVEPIFEHYGFELSACFSAVQSRSFVCTLPILYDKSDLNEQHRAKECHDMLVTVCTNRGFPPYRSGLLPSKRLFPEGDTYMKVLRKLKSSLDPNNVIASRL